MYRCIVLCVVVTMYLGVEEPRAEMPTWAKWTVLSFGAWRLLADMLLTLVNFCSGKSRICLIIIISKLIKRHVCLQNAAEVLNPSCLKAVKSIACKVIF